MWIYISGSSFEIWIPAGAGSGTGGVGDVQQIHLLQLSNRCLAKVVLWGPLLQRPQFQRLLLQRRSRQHRLGKKWKVKQLLKRSCRVKWLAALLRFLLLSLLQSQPQAKLQSRAHLAKRVVLKCTGLRASQHWSWVQWSRFKMKSCQIGRKRKNLLLVQCKPLLSKCPHRLGCFQPMSPRWSMRSCLANTLMEMLVPWQTWGSGPTMFQGHLWHGYWNGRTRTILCLSLDR